MTGTGKPPWEHAVRALCMFQGHRTDTGFEGEAMWQSYLDEVELVIVAAMGEEAMRNTKDAKGPKWRRPDRIGHLLHIR